MSTIRTTRRFVQYIGFLKKCSTPTPGEAELPTLNDYYSLCDRNVELCDHMLKYKLYL